MAVTDDRNEQLHALGAFIRGSGGSPTCHFVRWPTSRTCPTRTSASSAAARALRPCVAGDRDATLDLSAETLPTQAGLFDPEDDEPPETLSTEAAIRRERTAHRRPEQALLGVYRSYGAGQRRVHRAIRRPLVEERHDELRRGVVSSRSRKKWFAPGTTSRRAIGDPMHQQPRVALRGAPSGRGPRPAPRWGRHVYGATATTTTRARRQSCQQSPPGRADGSRRAASAVAKSLKVFAPKTVFTVAMTGPK